MPWRGGRASPGSRKNADDGRRPWNRRGASPRRTEGHCPAPDERPSGDREPPTRTDSAGGIGEMRSRNWSALIRKGCQTGFVGMCRSRCRQPCRDGAGRWRPATPFRSSSANLLRAWPPLNTDAVSGIKEIRTGHEVIVKWKTPPIREKSLPGRRSDRQRKRTRHCTTERLPSSAVFLHLGAPESGLSLPGRVQLAEWGRRRRGRPGKTSVGWFPVPSLQGDEER